MRRNAEECAVNYDHSYRLMIRENQIIHLGNQRLPFTYTLSIGSEYGASLPHEFGYEKHLISGLNISRWILTNYLFDEPFDRPPLSWLWIPKHSMIEERACRPYNILSASPIRLSYRCPRLHHLLNCVSPPLGDLPEYVFFSRSSKKISVWWRLQIPISL